MMTSYLVSRKRMWVYKWRVRLRCLKVPVNLLGSCSSWGVSLRQSHVMTWWQRLVMAWCHLWSRLMSTRCDDIVEDVYVDRILWEELVHKYVTRNFTVFLTLHSIISNSYKHTHSGSICIILTSTVPGTVSLIVKDTGAGIPQQELQDIFVDKFKSGELFFV